MQRTLVYDLHLPTLCQYQDPAGTNSGAPVWTPTYSKKLEIERLFEDNNPLSLSYKPVEHSVTEHFALFNTTCEFNSAGNPVHRAWQGAGSYWLNWGMAPLQLTPFQLEQRVRRVYPHDDQWLLNEAKQAFMNVNQVDSLLNIVEAPELPNSVIDITKKLSNVECSYQKSPRSPVIKRRLKELLKVATGGHLLWSFGLAPLISDIKKVTQMAPKLKRGLQRAKKDAGQITRTHFSLQGEAQLVTTTPYLNGSYVYCQDELLVLAPPRKIATVIGVNSHLYEGEAFNKLQYLLQRVGTSGPASYAWERIPFSFVADWFVDTRNVLNTLDNLLTGGQKNIIAMGISEKYHYQVNQRHKNGVGSTYWDFSHNEVIVSGTRVKHYHRALASTGFPIVVKGQSGKNHAAIAGSLLSQLLVR